LGTLTDASYRFERGIDSEGCLRALNKAATLIMEIAGGQIASQTFQHNTPKSKASIKINYEKINYLLGTNLEQDLINEILSGLGFKIVDNEALVPSWRNDIAIWQDLAEEVARIYGFNKIPKSPIKKTEPPRKSIYRQKEAIKDILVDRGFSEFYGYSFLSGQDLKITNLSTEDLLEVANPVSPENKYMRKSLIPGLLKAVAKNAYFDPILMFEIGNVFTKEAEITHLGIVASGKDAKKYLEKVLDQLNIKKVPTETKRDELERYKIRKPVTYTVEIDIDEILDNLDLQVKNKPLRASQSDIPYLQVSKYPPMARDIAFVLDEHVNDREIGATISESSDKIFLIEKFDEFVSEKIGKGNKSVAYHIYLQDLNKALTLGEADNIISRIISNLDSKLKAKIRG
jgi:phenylalanyl-tRNA synthetase beta chain